MYNPIHLTLHLVTAPTMPNLASVEIDTPANKGETKIRRSYRAPDRLLERPADGINTMADVFLKAKERE